MTYTGAYPNYMPPQSNEMVLEYASAVSTFAPGDKIVGVTSGATAWFAGYMTNPSRILLTTQTPGPYDTPFLPGEVVQKVGNPAKSVTLGRFLGASKASGAQERIDEAI